MLELGPTKSSAESIIEAKRLDKEGSEPGPI